MKQTNRTLSILLAILMLFSVATTAMAGNGNGGGNGSGGGSTSELTLVSATIGDTPLAEATEIRSNAEILLTFSANVTDDAVLAFNIGKVNVKDSNNQNVSSVTVSKGGTKKLTVSLGGVEKAAYTLTIGKEFKDVNGNTLGTKVEIPFTVNKGDGSGSGGGNNPLSFGGAKANDADLNGATLKGDEIITLQFDRGMKTNEDANAALIGVYKADGTKAAYTVLPVDDSDEVLKQQVKVQLGGLAAGDYTLKIGKDVKANNGNKLGEDVTISFSVKGADNDKTDFLRGILDALVKFFKSIVEFFKNTFKK